MSAELIDKIRDFMCKINRVSDLNELHTAQRMISPPYKGPEDMQEEKIYPPQLIGSRGKTDQQRVRLGGSTGTGGGGYGGVVGAYGSPTGGSYIT